MATGDDLRRIALGLTGTTEAPHFDRAAFKVLRTYVTLPADGLTANVKLAPDAQAFKTMLAPHIYRPIPNAWGRQGWTTIDLAAIDVAELAAVIEEAHRLGAAKKQPGKAPGKRAKTGSARSLSSRSSSGPA